ncbi:MAG: hypothetical protein ABFS34_02780 [Gemmatimonadota bacterium]
MAHEPLQRGRLAGALPTVADLVFIGMASLVVSAAALPVLTGDGDLASHIRMGELILAGGTIPEAYPFTYAMEGSRFLGHAWLGEVVLAATHSAGGLAAVLVLAGVLIGLCFAMLCRFLVARGVGVYAALAATGLAAGGSVLHWLGRSHLFTWYFALLLLILLENPRARAWWLAPLFVLWTNLHGGFTYGILLVGLYLLAAAIDALVTGRREGAEPTWRTALRRARQDATVRRYAGFLGWAIAGSLVNPRGPLLYLEIATLLGDASIIDRINEFQSPDFHWGFATPFLLALLLAYAALALRRARLPTAWILVLLANTYYALYSARNIPLFLLVAFPLMVIFAARGWPALAVRPARPGGDFLQEKALQGPGWLSFVFALGLSLVAVNEGRLAGAQLLPNGFSPDRFPVEAVRAARAADLAGPLFNEMVWGGYVAYAWPERRAYIDGLLYDGELLEEYRTIAMARPGWREAIEGRGMRLALVAPGGALAEHLVDEPGWGLRHCDGTAAVIVLRQGGERGAAAHERLAGCRQEADARADSAPRLTE